MNLFEEVKEMVPVKAAATAYGTKIKSNGMAICPFHNDHSPSMKFYEKNYHCFGCGAHGDVIDYVGNLYGIPGHDAAMKLNRDFNLGITEYESDEYSLTKEHHTEPKKVLTEEEKRRAFSLEVRDLRNKLRQAKEILDSWKYGLRPKNIDVPPEDWDPRFVMANICRDRIDFFIDIIDFGERWEIEKLLSHREEVLDIVERIRRIEENPDTV